MLVACCHIPLCPGTCGRKGFLCPRHWALVPREQQLRALAAARGLGRAKKGTQLRSEVYARLWEQNILAIRDVLVALWEMGFPWPPDHQLGIRRCACRMCVQAYAVALESGRNRRFVDPVALAIRTARADEA